MEENRAFLEMLKPAVLRLQDRDPLEIARNAGVIFDTEQSEFAVFTLGQEIRVRYPSCELSQELEPWHTLLLLHYLDLADGTPLTGEWVSFGMLKDGVVRGTKFDRTAAAEFERWLKGKAEKEIREICEAMGAEFLDSKADLSVRLPLFPNCPLLLNIWLEDDEFPPSAKLLADRSVDHYLTIEDAVTAGEVVLSRWRSQGK